MKIRFSKVLLAAGVLAACTLFAPALVRANEQVYQKVLPGAVWVHSDMGNGLTSFGSGVLVDAQRRWVLTNYHVVRDRTNARVFFPSWQNGEVVSEKSFYMNNAFQLSIPGRVVATRQECDLAVIELERLPAEAQVVSMASTSARPGQVIHLIGNPGVDTGLWLYSFGKVRQVHRSRTPVGDGKGFSFIRDCRVVVSTMGTNPGDSGGPLVNDSGELVGLHASSIPSASVMSYGIDVTEIRNFLAQVASGNAGQAPPMQPNLPGTGTTPPAQPPQGHSLLGTWKATTVHNGKQVDVTLTVQNDQLQVVFQAPGGLPVIITGPYRYSNNLLQVLYQGQWQNVGQITWINASEFTSQDPLVTLHFRKVS
jgi:S1-C subfamily serine protease